MGNNIGVVGDGDSTTVSVWSQSQGGFNLLKGGSNITVTLYDNVITFNTANIYTGSQVNTKLNDYVLSTTLNGYYAKAAVDGLIAGILDSAPENLNSLREIALSLGNDSNLSSTIFTALSLKLSTADFNTTIANYTTTSTLTGNFYTKTQVNTLLSGYTTTSALTNILGSYALTSSLSSYAWTSSLSSYAPTASPTFTGAVDFYRSSGK